MQRVSGASKRKFYVNCLFDFVELITVQAALNGMFLLRQQFVPVLHGFDAILQAPPAVIEVLLLCGEPGLRLFERLIVRHRIDVVCLLVFMQIFYRSIVKQ